MGQPARLKKKSFHPANLIAQFFACCSLCQNPHNGIDKLVGGTSIKDSDRCTPFPAATRAPTLAAAPVVAPLIVFGSADFSVVRYLEDKLQQILGTVLKSRLPTSVPAPVVAAAPHYKGPCKRPLKAWFPNIYRSKTHLECYNFFQQCKDHFGTASATGPNQVSFMATFLKDTALLRWQQDQRKIEDQTNVSISLEGFKAFFHQSLGKSKAFVNIMLCTIRKDSHH